MATTDPRPVPLRRLPAATGWSFLVAGFAARLPQAMTPMGGCSWHRRPVVATDSAGWLWPVTARAARSVGRCSFSHREVWPPRHRGGRGRGECRRDGDVHHGGRHTPSLPRLPWVGQPTGWGARPQPLGRARPDCSPRVPAGSVTRGRAVRRRVPRAPTAARPRTRVRTTRRVRCPPSRRPPNRSRPP